jgi:FkbM family methyltransferase
MAELKVGINAESLAAWQAGECEMLRYTYPLTSADVVIDLGAYRGEFAATIKKMYGSRVIAVEPGPWIVGLPSVEVINEAAATFKGKMTFGGAYYYTSSFELNGATVYPCFDVNALLAEHEEVALLKVNVEGAEYPLLQHALSAGLQGRVRNLQVQFHEVDGAPYERWYAELAAELRKTHELTWRFPFCWESWRRRDA